KITLDRLQNNATAGEIWSGTAQNLMTKDLAAKMQAKPAKTHPIPLNEKLVPHLNVRSKDNHGNIGLLRNEGKFEWPAALREIATEKQQRDIGEDARVAFRRAADKKPITDLVETLRTSVDKLRTELLKRANDLPTQPYLQAKRFLNDFDDALLA